MSEKPQLTKVTTVRVSEDDDGVRLDKWFKKNYPGLPFGRLNKLLRTGQIRVDGSRAKGNDRLEEGQEIRVPPLDAADESKKGAGSGKVSEQDRTALLNSVVYEDRDIVAINKPSGLAVQGGSKTRHHVDAMLDVLTRKGAERPRLVHRLDKDTSGVLVLAKSRKAAQDLGEMFQGKEIRKTYLALVVGVPDPREGVIDLPLSKQGRTEKMAVNEAGKEAVTFYKVMETVENKAAWVELNPQTGRTHQLRAHMAALGHPIVGDGKYGGRNAYLEGFGKTLHLHARALQIPGFAGGQPIEAPLPAHMADACAAHQFNGSSKSNA